MHRKIRWLKASYLTGAVADVGIGSLTLIPNRMGEIGGHREPAPGVCPLLRRFFVGFHRRTTANQVAVAIDIVDATYRGPVLVLAQGMEREIGFFPGIGMRPVVLQQQVVSMRRVA